MSDLKNKNDELGDIDLCYKALGLSIGDSPPQVEMTYNRLMEIYKNNLKSADGHVREDAKNNMALISDMYENIKSSVTYQAMEKEYSKISKRSSDAGKSNASKSEAQAMRSTQKECPSCYAMVSKSETNCPKCKYEFKSVTDAIMSQVFSRTNLIVLSVIVLLVVVVIAGYLNRALIVDIVNTLRGGETAGY